MSVTSGRHRAEALQERRQLVGIRRLGGDLDDLLHRPAVAVLVPGPDGGGEVLQADDAVDEAMGLGRVVRRPQLENELVVRAEVDLLQVLALGQVPEVQAAAVLGAEQDFRHQAVLHRVRRAPFAGHHGVVAEVPPAVVAERLRAAVHLPASERLEALVVHDEDAAGRVALRVAERGHVDAARSAMDGVRARVAGLGGQLLRLDHLDDLRGARIGLGVEDVDARGAQSRHDEVAPLHMRVRHVRAEAGRAGVPAEMVQLVARVRHRHGVEDASVARRRRVDIHHRDRVRPLAVRIEGGDVGDGLRRGLRRHARRGIEARIGSPGGHVSPPVTLRVFALLHGSVAEGKWRNVTPRHACIGNPDIHA